MSLQDKLQGYKDTAADADGHQEFAFYKADYKHFDQIGVQSDSASDEVWKIIAGIPRDVRPYLAKADFDRFKKLDADQIDKFAKYTPSEWLDLLAQRPGWTASFREGNLDDYGNEKFKQDFANLVGLGRTEYGDANDWHISKMMATDSHGDYFTRRWGYSKGTFQPDIFHISDPKSAFDPYERPSYVNKQHDAYHVDVHNAAWIVFAPDYTGQADDYKEFMVKLTALAKDADAMGNPETMADRSMGAAVAGFHENMDLFAGSLATVANARVKGSGNEILELLKDKDHSSSDFIPLLQKMRAQVISKTSGIDPNDVYRLSDNSLADIAEKKLTPKIDFDSETLLAKANGGHPAQSVSLDKFANYLGNFNKFETNHIDQTLKIFIGSNLKKAGAVDPNHAWDYVPDRDLHSFSNKFDSYSPADYSQFDENFYGKKHAGGGMRDAIQTVLDDSHKDTFCAAIIHKNGSSTALTKAQKEALYKSGNFSGYQVTLNPKATTDVKDALAKPFVTMLESLDKAGANPPTPNLGHGINPDFNNGIGEQLFHYLSGDASLHSKADAEYYGGIASSIYGHFVKDKIAGKKLPAAANGYMVAYQHYFTQEIRRMKELDSTMNSTDETLEGNKKFLEGVMKRNGLQANIVHHPHSHDRG